MSDRVRFLIARAEGLGPFVAGLRALERDILYPIADGGDHFRIDHGPEYAPFFTGLGDAYFGVALAGDEVAGGGVAIIRRALAGDREIVAGYGCDYKLGAKWRGKGIGRGLGFFALGQMLAPRNKQFRTWRFAYGAAMRGAKGDVLRSARGFHPLKLLAPYAELAVYFVDPERLAALDVSGAPARPDSPGLDLSPETQVDSQPHGIVSTAGRKDLRLVSTGESWPLQHLVLGPRCWDPTLAEYLRSAGRSLAETGKPGPACFALDRRLGEQIAWLESRGVSPGATCRIAAWRLYPSPGHFPWVHLATSEI